MTTKQLFKELVEATYSIPVRNSVTGDATKFWTEIGVDLGLIGQVLTDFVTTMAGT